MFVLRNHFQFIKKNKCFLFFGFFLTLGSSFGQTYFIALFSAEVMSELGLTHGDYGSLYSLATLASALTLVWLGRKIDNIDLRWFCLTATLSLAIACVIMATAKTIFFLTLALFALRLTGQGLMSHAAATSMARYFEKSGGFALSISSAGFPIGEAIFPLLVVFFLTLINWREMWLAIAVIVGFGVTGLVQIGLLNHIKRHEQYLQRNVSGKINDQPQIQWSYYEVIHDSTFYYICLVTLVPAFIITGLFFHQVHLVKFKGWSLDWFAISFAIFACSRFIASITVGLLIDRVGARRLLPWYLVPLIIGLITLATSDFKVTAFLFMMLAGISTGGGANISGALWAEIYGLTHLGAIRALASAVMVFTSALSPALLGWLIDTGITMNTITLTMAMYSIVASLVVYFRLSM